MNTLRLNVQVEFLAAGTLLKRNAEGDYYITRSDELHMNSPVKMPTSLRISGEFLRDNPALYTIVEGLPSVHAHLADLRYAVLDGKGDSELLAKIAQLQQILREPASETD